MDLVRRALTDSAITFLWVLYIASMRPASVLLASTFELQGYEFPIILGLLAINIFLFSWLGRELGGAYWNPTTLLAFYSVGISRDSLFTIAVRYPAQAAGAVGGVRAIKELVPSAYKHLLGGPRLMVDANKGLLAEFILTFIMIFSVLFAVLKGPRNFFLRTWIIILATYVVIILGAGYTGPCMNPAHAFGWAYVNDVHYKWEHLLVFWLAPLAGTVMASWVAQLAFLRKIPKEKAA